MFALRSPDGKFLSERDIFNMLQFFSQLTRYYVTRLLRIFRYQQVDKGISCQTVFDIK